MPPNRHTQWPKPYWPQSLPAATFLHLEGDGKYSRKALLSTVYDPLLQSSALHHNVQEIHPSRYHDETPVPGRYIQRSQFSRCQSQLALAKSYIHRVEAANTGARGPAGLMRSHIRYQGHTRPLESRHA